MPGLEQQKMQTLYNISKVIVLALLFSSCSEGDETSVSTNNSSTQTTDSSKDAWYVNSSTIQGEAQGTTFTIKTSDDSLYITPDEVAEFFDDFDDELSTYKEHSLISRMNSNDIKELKIDTTRYFQSVFDLSNEVSGFTDGAFDPTVFPLVEMWGFFKNPHDPPRNEEIDSVLQFVGLLDSSCFLINEYGVLAKTDPRARLDFNAIAQGQSVDELAKILENRNQQNYFIEVGGEIRAKGKNNRGTNWVIGIDEPTDSNNGVSSQRKLENYLKIDDKAIATSGNYRKFYIKDGQKYSHTIDPETGKPVQHNLLSATVVADNAAVADAYATAFMTMGVSKSLKFVEEHPDLNLEVYLLFENNLGRIERSYSRGMNSFFMK